MLQAAEAAQQAAEAAQQAAEFTAAAAAQQLSDMDQEITLLRKQMQSLEECAQVAPASDAYLLVCFHGCCLLTLSAQS